MEDLVVEAIERFNAYELQHFAQVRADRRADDRHRVENAICLLVHEVIHTALIAPEIWAAASLVDHLPDSDVVEAVLSELGYIRLHKGIGGPVRASDYLVQRIHDLGLTREDLKSAEAFLAFDRARDGSDAHDFTPHATDRTPGQPIDTTNRIERAIRWDRVPATERLRHFVSEIVDRSLSGFGRKRVMEINETASAILCDAIGFSLTAPGGRLMLVGNRGKRHETQQAVLAMSAYLGTRRGTKSDVIEQIFAAPNLRSLMRDYGIAERDIGTRTAGKDLGDNLSPPLADRAPILHADIADVGTSPNGSGRARTNDESANSVSDDLLERGLVVEYRWSSAQDTGADRAHIQLQRGSVNHHAQGLPVVGDAIRRSTTQENPINTATTSNAAATGEPAFKSAGEPKRAPRWATRQPRERKGGAKLRNAKTGVSKSPRYSGESGRSRTKQEKLIAMLRQPDGVTVEAAVKALGWQPHTVRGAISGALKKKLGFNVTSEKVEGRGRVYKIAD